ncbi:unnamed protein product [Trichobilharzia regenti]|nr:unnamed protein product [Trichobilharzia regenti]
MGSFHVDCLGTFWCYNLYREYAACAVVDSNGPTPYLYFNRGIDLFNIVSPNAQNILHSLSSSSTALSEQTRSFERWLLRKYSARARVICAADENGRSYLHELVFCFNENSTLINCSAEYANDLQTYVYSFSLHAEMDYNKQIEKQEHCRKSFTVPAYKMPEMPTEELAVTSTESTSSSSSSHIFAVFWNWFWRLLNN